MKLSALYIVLDNHEWKHKDADLKSLIVVQFSTSSWYLCMMSLFTV